jgi:hypothetical protein
LLALVNNREPGVDRLVFAEEAQVDSGAAYYFIHEHVFVVYFHHEISTETFDVNSHALVPLGVEVGIFIFSSGPSFGFSRVRVVDHYDWVHFAEILSTSSQLGFNNCQNQSTNSVEGIGRGLLLFELLAEFRYSVKFIPSKSLISVLIIDIE